MKKRKQQNMMTGNQRRRASKPRHRLEALEQRMLLTTLFGGQTFQYMDPRGQLTTVSLSGNAIVELVGSTTGVSVTPSGTNIAITDVAGIPTVTGGSELILNDIPGIISGGTTGANTVEADGGLTGTDGVEDVGPIFVAPNPFDANAPTQQAATLSVTTSSSGTSTVDFQATNLNIQALAERPGDDLTTAYGFNIVTYTETIGSFSETIRDYELLKLSYKNGQGHSIDGTVLADMNLPGVDEVTNDTSTPITSTFFPVTAITASAFLPGTNTLYFVTETPVVGAVESTPENFDIFNLYSVNVETGQVSIRGNGTGDLPSPMSTGLTALTGITFVPTKTAGTYNLLMYGEGPIVTGTTVVNSGELFTLTGFTASGPGSGVGTPVPLLALAASSAGSTTPTLVPVTGITGITFTGSQTPAGASDVMIYATTGISSPLSDDLLAIDYQVGNGLTQVLGPMPDAKDVIPPTATDPLPTSIPVADEWGVNVGDLTWNADVTNPFTGGTGVLMGVDSFTGNIIMIDSRYRPAASDIFSIYVVQSDYSSNITISNAGTSITTNVDGFPVSSPAGSGGVLIGALSATGTLPTTAGDLTQDIGMRSAATDELPSSSSDNISSGVDVTSQYTQTVIPTNPNAVNVVVTLNYTSADIGDVVTIQVTSSDGGLNQMQTTKPALPGIIPPATALVPFVFPTIHYVESNSAVTYTVTILKDTLHATDLTAMVASQAANGLLASAMGENLDIIGAMAADQFGNIAVVDTDNNGADGNPISFTNPADQLALINPANGNDETMTDSKGNTVPVPPVTITFNGANLHNIEGLAYGLAGDFTTADPTAADELLYAVYTINTFDPTTGAVTPHVWFGTLTPDATNPTTQEDFTEITDLTTVPGLGPNIAVSSIAFGPAVGSPNPSDPLDQDQQLYLLATPDTTAATTTPSIYELTYTAGSITGQITQITGAISGVPVTTTTTVGGKSTTVGANIGAITFDAADNLVALDRGTANLDTINLSTGATAPYTNISLPNGTLGNAVGSIAYDPSDGEMLAVNNGLGQTVYTHQIDATTTLPTVAAESSLESANLLVIEDSATAQSIGILSVAGTVLGHVNISGSAVYVYMGWVGTGQLDVTGGVPTQDPNNFFVGGDLRTLYTPSGIGILTGVDMNIVGKVGTITTAGDFSAYLTIGDQVTSQTLTSNIPFSTPPTPLGSAGATTGTTAPPQMLGTLSDGIVGDPNVILATGTVGLGADYVYGVALMAGQTVTVQMTTEAQNPGPTVAIPVAIVDPDGRLFTSDVSQYGNAAGEPITFTTQLAGIYKFEVGLFDTSGQLQSGVGAYELSILGAGDMAIGALSVGGSMAETFFPPSASTALGSLPASVFTVTSGDVGAILVTGGITFNETSNANVPSYRIGDLVVDAGNLRDIEAGSIGTGVAYLGGGINFNIPDGSIGQILSAGALTINAINQDDAGNFTGSTVSGNIQMINGAGDVWLDVAVDGNIGTIRAGSMTGDYPDPFDPGFTASEASVIMVNADNSTTPGIIDLIQCAGDFGSLFAGGPKIITGHNGDVRYLTVGGAIYQDRYFGAIGVSQPQVYPAGQSVTVQDDSGARITLTPVGPTTSSTANGVTSSTGPALTLRTYGIEGSGGSVIVDATVAGGGGLTITSNGTTGEPAEVSQINLSDSGNAPTFGAPTTGTGLSALGGAPALGTGATPVSLFINGNTTQPIDVFSLVGNVIDSISNSTGGEILNVTASSIGSISAIGSLGVSTKSHTGAVVEMGSDVYDAFPFSHLRDGIVAGDIGFVTAKGAVGNIVATAELGDVTADSGGKETPGVFDGIAAPIFSTGEIYLVNIGDGIAPSGGGDMSAAGIYSDGLIDNVVGKGVGHDILGNIISASQIGVISLNGGVINNADIWVTPNLDQSKAWHNNVPVTDAGSSSVAGAPGVGSIDSIALTGIGGMLNDVIKADQVFNVSVKQGFGIIGVDIGTSSDGLIGNITADGFGLINDSFITGLSIGNLNASQRSTSHLSTTSYSPTVQAPGSESAHDKAVFDLATNLGSTKGLAGVISNVVAEAAFTAGNITGYQLDDSTFHFAQSVAELKIDTTVTGLDLTTGKLNTFLTGSTKADGSLLPDLDADGNPTDRNKITVAGPIASFKVYGNVTYTDIDINFNGIIKALQVYASPTSTGDFINSTIISEGSITTLAIAGQAAGTITASAIGTFTAGSMENATVTLDQPLNAPGFKTPTLNKLAVKGAMDNSTILSAGNIVSVSLGAMTSSTIFAGIDPTLIQPGSAPNNEVDFLTNSEIGTLVITGVPGQAVAFQDSDIAASQLGSITLTEVPTDGTADDNITGHTLVKLYLRYSSGKTVAKTVKGPVTGTPASPLVIDPVDEFTLI